MAVKKWNGKTVETDEGYFPEEVLKAMRKRLAEENAKSNTAKKPATKKPTKKSK